MFRGIQRGLQVAAKQATTLAETTFSKNLVSLAPSGLQVSQSASLLPSTMASAPHTLLQPSSFYLSQRFFSSAIQQPAIQKPHPYTQWAVEQFASLDPQTALEVLHSDMAGTLVNKYCTLPLIIFAHIFEMRGFKLTPDQITGPMGLKKIEHIRHYPSENDAVILNAEFEEMLFEKIADPEYTELTPHTSEMMQFILSQSMQLATTSGYVRKAADLAMTQFHRLHKVNTSTTSDEVIGGKRISMVHANMHKLSLPLNQLHKSLFITDAQSDVLSVRNPEDSRQMPWIVGLSGYSAHVGVISNSHANSLSPQELAARRKKAETLLDGAHIVIDDMSSLPLALVAVRKALQAGLMPAETKKLELLYPEQVRHYTFTAR
jgi:phosphonoacetaldehyde hydrolase